MSLAKFLEGELAIELVAILLERLCELLANADTRYAAANALAAIKDPRAIEPLVAAPAHPGPISFIAHALMQLNAVDAVPAIADAMLGDREPNDRKSCFYALSRLDPRTAAPAVAACADPDDTNFAVLGIVEAGALDGDPASFAFLDRVRQSTNQRMRQAATKIIARTHP